MKSERSGEDELIRLIQRTVKRRGRVRLGIGDDAAILRDGTVITTDAYAEGVHFDLGYMSLRQVGERCACGAISDVVAMGAEPEAVLVALALPRVASLQFAVCRSGARRRTAKGEWRGATRQLYSGIESVCREMGCEVAGGDIIVADRLLLALTVTGKTSRPKFRSGAKAGDSLYVTGHLGSAEAGRMLLRRQVKGQRSKVKGQNEQAGETRSQRCRRGWRMARGDWLLPLVQRHLRPVPRLGVMRAVKSRIHGLIDTSDGLATDARHLAEMSRVRIVLDSQVLPVLPGVLKFCAARRLDPLEFTLSAGEDYELLLASRSSLPDSVNGVKVTRIGSIEKGRGLYMRRGLRTLPVTASGYDHLGVDKG
jgi:thiamine-monophosphate kinase